MIDLSGEARRRIRGLRVALGLSIHEISQQTSLANGQGGVAPTTLYRLFAESNEPYRIQDATLHRVCEVFAARSPVPRTPQEMKDWLLYHDPPISISDLLGKPDSTSVALESRAARQLEVDPAPSAHKKQARRAPMIVLGLGIGAILGTGGLIAARTAWTSQVSNSLEVSASGSSIQAKAPFAGTLWTKDHPCSISFWERAPWGNGKTIVYGLWSGEEEGGRVYSVDAKSGEMLWKNDPNLEEVREIFGPEMAKLGVFRSYRHAFADMDGDGDKEILVHRFHDLWFPASLTVLRRDGVVIGTYYNWGQIYDLLVVDIDSDGKQEVLLSGTNNAYQGATLILLDDTHCHGASVDSLVNPTCQIQDSSLVRLILPSFAPEFMRRPLGPRLMAADLAMTRDGGGRAQFTASVGESGAEFVVTFGEDLAPIKAVASDVLLFGTKDWPQDLRSRFLSDGHLSEWMGLHLRFGVLGKQPQNKT